MPPDAGDILDAEGGAVNEVLAGLSGVPCNRRDGVVVAGNFTLFFVGLPMLYRACIFCLLMC